MSHLEKHPRKPEAPEKNLKSSLIELRQALVIHPVLAFLEKFDTFFKKKKKELQSGEVLFTPGENPYFYIVSSGALVILRQSPTGEKKEIGKAYTGSFIGEGILFWRNQKDVEAVAHGDSVTVIALTKEEIDYLESQSPKETLDLYKYVLEVTNGRLLDTGKELATMYETTEKINEYAKLWEKGFVEIVDLVKNILHLDYVVYVEHHSAVDGLYVYKYDTKNPSLYPINQKAGPELHVTEKAGSICGGEIPGTSKNDTIYLLPLKSGEKIRGALVLWKKTTAELGDFELRVINHIGPLLGSIVESNQVQAEKKALAMMHAKY